MEDDLAGWIVFAKVEKVLGHGSNRIEDTGECIHT